ncbi:MAG: hypothetical protein JO209_09850 [Acidisphaera sp.]|nr:hypothetical protein [Acidisphaera sp.]
MQALLDRFVSPGLRRLLPGLLALGVAAELSAWWSYGALDRRIAAQTAGLVERIHAEDEALRGRLHALNVTPAPGSVATVEPTAFLRQIDAVAGRTGVQVLRVVPRPNTAGVLDVALAASFPQFLRFAAAMEMQSAALHGLQIAPPEGAAPGSERRAIGFTLDLPRRPALAGRHADAVLATVADPSLRDPFTSGNTPAADTAGTDLSAKYHLTGITEFGDGYMATIDGRDYREGDRLDGMSIDAVGRHSVALSGGGQHYTLGLAGKPE